MFATALAEEPSASRGGELLEAALAAKPALSMGLRLGHRTRAVPNPDPSLTPDPDLNHSLSSPLEPRRGERRGARDPVASLGGRCRGADGLAGGGDAARRPSGRVSVLS